ncbi:MAG: hypothetical protein ACI92G_002620 [Candidatus Pelagisphaera sp.]|jgi:hypothetical protein
MRSAKPVIWLLILVTAYSLAHLFWYWQTPLGQLPALDGQENLLLANSISDGSLETEPFYRAILYPSILAAIPIHWMLLGLGCHIVNTILAVRLCRKLWNNRIGELITGGLVGFNPVLLHFAFDPLDITLSISLFLGAVNLVTPASSEDSDRPTNAIRFLASGLALALAALARPHFFGVLMPACLVAAGFIALRPTYRKPASTFLLAAIIPLLAFGAIQKARSGSFAILPTQGGYNLWASNRPGANGLYLKQTLNFHYIGEHKNPTRLESEELYRRETGAEGTSQERSAYWKSKAVEHIFANPIDWTKLMSFKVYAWLNNNEQYNNKTYSFHKALSPWIRYNPIGWGLLLFLAAVSFTILLRNNRTLLLSGLGLFACYSGAALLYMASARFRLPMVPLLAIMAGGIPIVTTQWRSIKNTQQSLTGIVLAAIALLAFSQFGTIASKDTIQQDTMLLADTASRAGRDLQAYNWADQTLDLNDSRQDARRLRLLSYYNLVSIGLEAPTEKSWSDFESDLDKIELDDPYIRFAKGVCLWNLGERDQASLIWKQNFETHSWNAASSLAALIYTNADLPEELPPYPKASTTADPLLVFALNQSKASKLKQQTSFPFKGTPEFEQLIERSLSRALPGSF